MVSFTRIHKTRTPISIGIFHAQLSWGLYKNDVSVHFE